MNNFLLMIGALMVGLLTALVAVPMVIDWNSYRGVFEEEASRLLGRDVRVGGGVNLRILPVPFVRFEKLRIADTTSTGGDSLFRAESVTLQLSVAPLLRGVLEAKSVELKRPMLRLAVDSEGRANWRSLTLQPGALPFIPADVALQSVGIEDGKLVLAGSTASDIAEVDGIAGDLSADSFDGPYRFKGTADWGGGKREIKATTAKPDADGALRFRLGVRTPDTDMTTTFDGRVTDLKGHPRFDGDLAAKVRLAGGGATSSKAADDQNLMDFKAKASGDLKGGELKDIELSRDDPADPQLVTGSARAAWDSAIKVDLALAAKSFNLDWLSGAAPSPRGAVAAAADPVQTARTALAVALGALPAESETSATFKADRATLHGEALSGVSLAVERRGGTLEIRSLKAGLPGGTRLLASGLLTKDPHQPGFTGPVSLRGANLARFIAWAYKASATDSALLSRCEGPYALEGQLAMTGSLLELTRASAELSGHTISGELRYNAEGRRRVGLVLDGERIEAQQLWPGGLDPAALRAYFSGSSSAAAPAGKASTTGFYGFDPATTDLTLTVRAGELQATQALLLRDVDAALSVTGGSLTISRLKFSTGDGLGVEADGALKGFAGASAKSASNASSAMTPAGTVRWMIDAPTREAVSALISSIDWPAANRPSEATVQALAGLGPVHLAGSTTLSERAPRSLEITADGMIDTGPVSAHARLDRGLSAWTTAPLEVTARVSAPDVWRWLALAGFATPPAGASGPAARPGTLTLSAAGTPSAGLATYAALAADQTAISSNGRATLSEQGGLSYEGLSSVQVRDVTDALSLAGLSLGQGPSDVAFAGNVHIERSPASLVLETSGDKLGVSPVFASAELKPDAARPGVRLLTASVALAQVNVPALAALFSERRPQPGAAGWSEQPLRLPATLSGRIDLTANRLVLDGDAGADHAVATLRIEPEAITVENLTASALGGTLKAAFTLKPEAPSYGLSGTLGVMDANLSALSPAAAAPLSVSAKLKGQGLSAAAIVASLTGTGEADLGAGQIKGVAPAGIAGVVDKALAGKDPIVGDALGDTLRQSLAASSLALAPIKVPFAVTYGVARANEIGITAADGRTMLDASLDINSLRYALDWRIQAASKPSPSGIVKPALSALHLSAQGPLSTLPSGDTALALGAFEQELVVRKMEHDAEELERLRKADEERRRIEEAERLKREEAERQKAAEAAAAANASKPDASGLPVPEASDAAAQGAGSPNGGTPGAPPPGAAPPTPTPPAPAPAVRRRAPSPPQASGIPQPFSNN